MTTDTGTLALGEAHPASYSAHRWIKSRPLDELMKWNESFASCAIEGDRLSEVCGETLNRLLNGEPVSDRYVLGLAWVLLHATLDEV